MTLDRKAFLARRADIPRKAVEIPEWGETVYVRGMTAGERDWFDRAARAEGGAGSLRAGLVCRCVVDENGERLFEPSDEAAIAELPAQVVEKLALEILRLSGLLQEEKEQLEKN